MLNLLSFNTDALKSQLQRFQYLLIASLFSMAGLMPIVLQGSASAETLTSRSVEITTSDADATNVGYNFTFTMPGPDTPVRGIIMQFCDTALAACVLPSSMSLASAAVGSDDWTLDSDQFTKETVDAGDCSQTTDLYELCFERPTIGNETTGAKTINLTGIENPSLAGNFTNVFVRITLYSDNSTYASDIHEGTVVTAIVRQITVNGRVAERLDFCLGAVLDNNTGTGGEDTELEALDDNSICTDLPGDTVIDIGTIDDSTVTISPVAANPATGSNGHYGVAAVKTNASGGVVIAFYPENAGGTNHLNSFRVPGATCHADQTTGSGPGEGLVDQCFRSAAAGGEDFGALTGPTQERFGMQVSCFEQGDGTRSSTTALTADADFADGDVSDGVDCEDDDDDSNFAWNTTLTAADIASSVGVVDDELIKFNFGATASSTTPTGNYTVQSTYIATPTF